MRQWRGGGLWRRRCADDAFTQAPLAGRGTGPYGQSLRQQAHLLRAELGGGPPHRGGRPDGARRPGRGPAGLDRALPAPPGPAPLHLADLACGDLTTLAPLLGSLPLASCTGVDAVAAVLDRARERLAEAPFPFPCRWRHDDLLRWAEGRAESFTVVSCLFGLHHFADADKRRFLAALPGRLEPNGVLLISDAFREPGETRPAYLQRFGRRIREQWRSLPPPLQEHVLAHINGSDFPADRDVFLTLARETGWRAEWVWRGTQRVEALLALRRSPSAPSASASQEQEQQPQPQPAGHTGQGVGGAAAAPPEPGR